MHILEKMKNNVCEKLNGFLVWHHPKHKWNQTKLVLLDLKFNGEGDFAKNSTKNELFNGIFGEKGIRFLREWELKLQEMKWREGESSFKGF